MHVMHQILAFSESCEELVKGTLETQVWIVWSGLRPGQQWGRQKGHLIGGTAFGRTFHKSQVRDCGLRVGATRTKEIVMIYFELKSIVMLIFQR